jgi:hypothetical protein
MSSPLIPAPQGAEQQNTSDDQKPGNDRNVGGDHQNRPGYREKPSIPSLEDCLRAMAQLAGLIAMGLLKPSEANAIRAAYREILQHHKSRAKEVEKTLANADVMEVLRKDPQLLGLLEPLLTPEQVAMVMQTAEDDTDEQA